MQQNKPGYKHTPLGWIPEDWEVKRMKEVAKVQGGYAFDSKKFSPAGRYQVVKMSNVYNGILDLERSASYLNVLTRQEENFLLQRDDILITLTGTIGKRDYGYTYKINGEQNLVLNQRVARIIARDGIADPQFLSYELKTNRVLDQFFFSARGGTGNQANVGTGDLELIKVVTPCFSEQRRIASILSIWDEAITKTQQLIAQLQQRNKGLMQQLLTEKDNWKEYRIGELLKEVKRTVKWNDEEVYHLISVRRRSGGAFFRESLYGKQILTKQLFTAEEGDFLISKMQIVHGASAVVPKELAGMKISGSYIAVHAKNEKVMDITFFNWLSKTRRFYRLTYVSSYGVHIEKMRFDFDDFKRRKIMLPPSVEEQNRIVKILQTASDEVRLYEQKLAALQQQKKGLMQKLLTGEVRVKIHNN